MPSMPRLARHDQPHHHEGPTDEVVLGVDTHKDVHVAAVITVLGALLASTTFPTTAAGLWVPNRSSASCDLGILVDQPTEGVTALDTEVG